MLSKRRGVAIANSVVIDIGTSIDVRGGLLKIANGVKIRSLSKGYHAGMPFKSSIFIDRPNATIEIGQNTRLNGVYIHAQQSIVIGNNCVIASGVNILDSNGHELLSYNRTQGRDTPSRIVIGDNVWLGLNVVVLKGTTIGKNSVVGANSVVKGDFEENSLILGNPAKCVKVLEFSKNS